jgi:hypothetical protein
MRLMLLSAALVVSVPAHRAPRSGSSSPARTSASRSLPRAAVGYGNDVDFPVRNDPPCTRLHRAARHQSLLGNCRRLHSG